MFANSIPYKDQKLSLASQRLFTKKREHRLKQKTEKHCNHTKLAQKITGVPEAPAQCHKDCNFNHQMNDIQQERKVQRKRDSLVGDGKAAVPISQDKLLVQRQGTPSHLQKPLFRRVTASTHALLGLIPLHKYELIN